MCHLKYTYKLRSLGLCRFLRETVSVVRCGVVNLLPHRNDTEWVDGRMTPIIMVLDMVHIDSSSDAGNLEQILRVVEQVGVLTDELLVGFEVDDVDLVEADQGHEQANVGLGEFVASNVPLLG